MSDPLFHPLLKSLGNNPTENVQTVGKGISKYFASQMGCKNLECNFGSAHTVNFGLFWPKVKIASEAARITQEPLNVAYLSNQKELWGVMGRYKL